MRIWTLVAHEDAPYQVETYAKPEVTYTKPENWWPMTN